MPSMAVYITRRIINMFITLLLLIAIVFTLIHVLAPSPYALARIWVGARVTPQALQAVIKAYGLDKPLYIQFINYVADVFTGNFGIDTMFKRPVLQVMATYLPYTLQLVLTGTVIALIIGVFTGAVAGAKKDTGTDYAIRVIYLVTWSMPPFLVAILLQLLIAYYLGLLPATGVVNPLYTAPKPITGWPLLDAAIEHDWPYFISMIRHLILPATSLALVSFGLTTRLMRNTMIDVINKDYIRTAIMKGLPERSVIYKHAMRNALIPIITIAVLAFATSIAGAVVIEDIFQYHGMGWFTTQALFNLDYPTILGFTFIVGISIMVANLVADLLYAVIDPRIRLE
ncbi:ABC transporter permease [Caldivirga sp. UBA161]|uniref:ABC transporter permease n=1 Tax=Caldivirga sp. UBA161 TaxID=1915569 RepID=UPI0025C10210|nr:ABC transporter permease [Caldivirga sp. UBA161]